MSQHSENLVLNWRLIAELYLYFIGPLTSIISAQSKISEVIVCANYKKIVNNL